MIKASKVARLKDVSFAYPAGNTALADINLHVNNAEILGVIGANGSGKTTFLKLLSGYLSATSGKVFLGKQSINDFSERMLNDYVAFVEQNPESQLSGPTVEDELARACRMMGLKGRSIERNVTTILKEMSLEDARDWFLDEISAGERRRVALSLTLLGQPKMLLLDEPFSDLDDEGISSTVEYLKKCRDKNLGIVISSHKLDDVLKVADRIAILEKGSVPIVDTPDVVVRNTELLKKVKVIIPAIPALCLELEAAGLLTFKKCPVTLEQAKNVIKKKVNSK